MVVNQKNPYEKQKAGLSHIAFEHEYQMSKAVLMDGIITQPLSFKAALLSKLPQNFDVIRFILQILKLLGQTPFSYDSKKEVYYFIWPSLDTAVAVAFALTLIFWIFVYTTHMVLEKFLIFGPG